jgi:hypothetical protein
MSRKKVTFWKNRRASVFAQRGLSPFSMSDVYGLEGLEECTAKQSVGKDGRGICEG